MPTCAVVVACGAIDCGLRIKSKYSFFLYIQYHPHQLGPCQRFSRSFLFGQGRGSLWLVVIVAAPATSCLPVWRGPMRCLQRRHRSCNCLPAKSAAATAVGKHTLSHTDTHTLSNTHTHKYKIHTHTQCARTSFFCCCANRRMRDLFISCACEHNNKKLVLCACVYVLCVVECPCVCVSVCANVCQVHCAALSPLGDLQPLSCFGWSGPRQVAAAVACNWPTRLL